MNIASVKIILIYILLSHEPWKNFKNDLFWNCQGTKQNVDASLILWTLCWHKDIAFDVNGAARLFHSNFEYEYIHHQFVHFDAYCSNNSDSCADTLVSISKDFAEELA